MEEASRMRKTIAAISLVLFMAVGCPVAMWMKAREEAEQRARWAALEPCEWHADLPPPDGAWWCYVTTEEALSMLLRGAARRPKEAPVPGWYLVRFPLFESLVEGREVWSLAEVRAGMERALASLPDGPGLAEAGRGAGGARSALQAERPRAPLTPEGAAAIILRKVVRGENFSGGGKNHAA